MLAQIKLGEFYCRILSESSGPVSDGQKTLRDLLCAKEMGVVGGRSLEVNCPSFSEEQLSSVFITNKDFMVMVDIS